MQNTGGGRKVMQSQAGPCVFTKEEGGCVHVVLDIHVDDTLIGGKNDTVNMTNGTLNKRLSSNNLGEVT